MQVQKGQMFFKLEIGTDMLEKCFKNLHFQNNIYLEDVWGGRFMVVFYFRTVSRPFLAKCKVEKSRFHLRNKSQN